jgi:hypothetical protein
MRTNLNLSHSLPIKKYFCGVKGESWEAGPSRNTKQKEKSKKIL